LESHGLPTRLYQTPDQRLGDCRVSELALLEPETIGGVSTAEAAVWVAAQGVGITRVFQYQCAAALRDGSLKIILAEYETPPLPVHLIHAGRGALPSKTRAFLDFAARRLRKSTA
jgi:DNA-binding transcriptional LysR family regulator